MFLKVPLGGFRGKPPGMSENYLKRKGVKSPGGFRVTNSGGPEAANMCKTTYFMQFLLI
jgi:hypothetical protein